MGQTELEIRFSRLTTAHIADGYLRAVWFADYLAARELDPAITFQEHLRAVGGAIEV